MLKSNTNGRSISQDENLHLENVTVLSIANYSDVSLLITQDDVTEVIPPFDASSGYPGTYENKPDGYPSDVKIQLEFDKTRKQTQSGNAVLRYKTVIINQDKCNLG